MLVIPLPLVPKRGKRENRKDIKIHLILVKFVEILIKNKGKLDFGWFETIGGEEWDIDSCLFSSSHFSQSFSDSRSNFESGSWPTASNQNVWILGGNWSNDIMFVRGVLKNEKFGTEQNKNRNKPCKCICQLSLELIHQSLACNYGWTWLEDQCSSKKTMIFKQKCFRLTCDRFSGWAKSFVKRSP